MKLLIVDDHSTVRLGLRLVVQEDPLIEVVGEAADGRAAVRMATALHPDVVLMDLRMPVLDGVEATALITAAKLARVLVLTTFDDDEYLFGALHAGAHGFLLKSSEPSVIINAVRATARGDSVLSAEVTGRVIAQALSSKQPEEPNLESLTERELEVLAGLGQGLSNPQLADQLGIGETTVKTHVSRVMAKLAVSSRLQAAKIAFARWG